MSPPTSSAPSGAGVSATQVAPHDGDPAALDWPELIGAVLADQTRLRLLFQPIVSLQDAVIVGYEALARFDGPPHLTPDLWFAAADRLGHGAELEAVVVKRCLQLRHSLPPNCFLTMNVSPHLLTHPQLSHLLLDAGDLHPLVIELTEHQSVADVRPLLGLRDALTRRGALMALDDAGSGYSGLQQMTLLRPHIIKLDRALVDGADRDEVKLALAELLGEFGGRIDAWLLAEGIETWGEVGAFQRLRVPLGQGYLLGRPAPAWSSLAPRVVERLRRGAASARLVDQVGSLVQQVAVEGREPVPPDRIGLRVDEHGHPTALLLPLHRVGELGHRITPISLRVAATTDVVELARRIVARPQPSRHDPVVCVDELGHPLGVVRVEQVLLRLAELKSDG